jgi:hypothetical protein
MVNEFSNVKTLLEAAKPAIRELRLFLVLILR